MRKLLLSALLSSATLFAATASAGPVVEPGNFTGNATFQGCDSNNNSKYHVTWWSGIGSSYTRLADNFNHTYGTWGSSTTEATIAISKDVLLKMYSENMMVDVQSLTHQCGTPVTPPTDAPSITSVSWDMCYGSNIVRFTAVNDATSYKVKAANGQSLGTTTGTVRHINVPYTQNVTVQACNDGGCGPDSAPARATYQNICY
ncbi:MAG: hypothetical protein JXR12_15385 [Neptunomonas phycophila]|uniref:hypothetical protein n=1 Tax=Neptunomonas phycophila TaxID=1572645 RepID=UPI003B8E5294